MDGPIDCSLNASLTHVQCAILDANFIGDICSSSAAIEVRQKCCSYCQFTTPYPTTTGTSQVNESCTEDAYSKQICDIFYMDGPFACTIDLIIRNCCRTCQENLYPSGIIPVDGPIDCTLNASLTRAQCAILDESFMGDICSSSAAIEVRRECCSYCKFTTLNPTTTGTTPVTEPCTRNLLTSKACNDAHLTDSSACASLFMVVNCCQFCQRWIFPTDDDLLGNETVECDDNPNFTFQDCLDFDTRYFGDICSMAASVEVRKGCCGYCALTLTTQKTTFRPTEPCTANTLSDNVCENGLNVMTIGECADERFREQCCGTCQQALFPDTNQPLAETVDCSHDELLNDEKCEMLDTYFFGNICSSSASEEVRQRCCGYCGFSSEITSTTMLTLAPIPTTSAPETPSESCKNIRPYSRMVPLAGTNKCVCPNGTREYRPNRCVTVPDEEEVVTSCTVDSCSDNFVCMNRKCMLRCTYTTDCGSDDFLCVQGVCVPNCNVTDDCATGDLCFNGACRALCTGRTDYVTCGRNLCIGRFCYQHPVYRKEDCPLIHLPLEFLCVPGCTSDTECDEFCFGGTCTQTCALNGANHKKCNIGRDCHSGICLHQCDVENTCHNTSLTCIYNRCHPTCKSDADCKMHWACTAGYCSALCSGDWTCTGADSCAQGICASFCSAGVPNICPQGFICDGENRQCVVQCTNDSDCSSYHTCDEDLGFCVSVINKPCAVHSDCDPQWNTSPNYYCNPQSNTCQYYDRVDGVCILPECGLNERCNMQTKLCELRPDYQTVPTRHPPLVKETLELLNMSAECIYDHQCRQPNFVCLSQLCYSQEEPPEPYLGCESDPKPKRMVPADGYLMNTCERTGDCDSSQLCVNCVCAATCVTNSECNTKQVCFAGICMETCSEEENECAFPGDTCLDRVCRDTCNANEDVAYGACSGGIITPRCNKTVSCPSGYICEQLICERLCDTEEDCASNQICGLSLCTETCSNEEASECVNGTLMNRCYSDVDCADGRKCSHGVCSPACTCTEVTCNVAPCDVINGWYCDRNTGGCAHPSQDNNTDEGDNLMKDCITDEDCGHYNLYCNVNSKCVPVNIPTSGHCEESQAFDLAVCGINSECIEGRCECIKDADGKCVASPPARCTSQGIELCPGDQICNTSLAMCMCPPGTTIIGSRCIELVPSGGGFYFAPCNEHEDCPPGSSCTSGNCYPHCETNCDDYPFMGCLFGMCSPECYNNADCDSNQYCCAGVTSCSTKCYSHHDCAQNQFCYENSCQPSCSTIGKCPSGHVCHKGACIAICTSDISCIGMCVQGLCSEPCGTGNPCADGKHCQNGKCIQPCDSANPCPESQICLQGYCSQDCEPNEDGCRELCSESSQCAPNNICFEGICSGSCIVDDDCGTLSNCVNGTCAIICLERLRLGCPSSQYCDNAAGYCKTYTGMPCTSSVDCPNDKYCSTEGCRDHNKVGCDCTTSADCGEEEICVNEKCECLRSANGDCVQTAISCVSRDPDSNTVMACSDSLPNSVCDPMKNWCVCDASNFIRLGDRCVQPVLATCSGTCSSGSECRGYRCYQRCGASYTSCPAGLSCVHGYCDFSCKETTNCNHLQKCDCGVCVNTCNNDDHCLLGQTCYNGVCQETCLLCGDGNVCSTDTCSTAGYACQSDTCLKVCPSTVSCRDAVQGITAECGCPMPTLTYDGCIYYDVYCPPTSYTPSGHTLIGIDVATNCDELVSNSVCSADGSTCVCKQGFIQYAGAVCQVLLDSCQADIDCETGSRCHQGYCYTDCAGGDSSCSFGTKCVQELSLCLTTCTRDEECIGYSMCQSGQYCSATVEELANKDSATNPACQDSPGETTNICEVPMAEVCVDGTCECIDGMRRSTITNRCEWLLDIVCHQCNPCSTSQECADTNMECSLSSSLCICKKGFVLSETGKKCEVDQSSLSEVDCNTNADCRLLPNSKCNRVARKCQCDEDYCYKAKFCQRDVNECFNVTCNRPGDVCVDVDCEESGGFNCVPTSYTDTIPSTDLQCSQNSDCSADDKLGQFGYCFAGTCTCTRGSSLLINDTCQPIDHCVQNYDCSSGYYCHYGFCLERKVRAQAALSAKDVIKNKDGSLKIDMVGSIITAVMGVAIVALIVATVHIRNEYQKKSQPQLESQNLTSKVEAKTDELESKPKQLSSTANLILPDEKNREYGTGASPEKVELNYEDETEKPKRKTAKKSASKSSNLGKEGKSPEKVKSSLNPGKSPKKTKSNLSTASKVSKKGGVKGTKSKAAKTSEIMEGNMPVSAKKKAPSKIKTKAAKIID